MTDTVSPLVVRAWYPGNGGQNPLQPQYGVVASRVPSAFSHAAVSLAVAQAFPTRCADALIVEGVPP